jgi:hypothetical protein
MTEHIEINGQNHPIIVNFYVIGEFQKETGESLSSLSDIDNKLFLVEPLLWHALRVGYIVNKQKIPFERDEMPILLSDNDIYNKFIITVSKFFPTSVDSDSDKKK